MKYLILVFIGIVFFSCENQNSNFKKTNTIIEEKRFDSCISKTMFESTYDSAKFYLYLNNLGLNIVVNNKIVYFEEMQLVILSVEDRGNFVLQTFDSIAKYKLLYTFNFYFDDPENRITGFQQFIKSRNTIIMDTISKKPFCLFNNTADEFLSYQNTMGCDEFISKHNRLGFEYLKLKKDRLHPWLYNECVKRKIFEDE
jgi:hypothetical protein